jgi:hypothetical protein
MAQYIKFRLTAAKVGVSMALAALIAGIAEKVHAAPPVVQARPAAVDSFLKLDGITGESKKDFYKLELKYDKLNSALNKLQSQLGTIYHKSTINSEFLKVVTANSEFLKSDAANSEFLKTVDASGEFLKISGTAANSNELGGLTPDAFFQGHGNVVSGEATVTSPTQSAPLLATADGTLSVSLKTSDGELLVNITNSTGNSLPAVQDLGEASGSVPGSTTTSSTTFAPGDNSIRLGSNVAAQLHLQIFPAGDFNEVVTLTVSVEPIAATGGYTAVGQMLNGGT